MMDHPELILFAGMAVALAILAAAVVVLVIRILWHTEQVRLEASEARRLEADRLERFTEKLMSDVGVVAAHTAERRGETPSPNGNQHAIPVPMPMDFGDLGDAPTEGGILR